MSQASDLQLEFDLTGREGQDAPPYRVRMSDRARRLQIAVSPFHGVEVIVPRRHSAKRVASFVARHQDWITQVWAEVLAAFPGQVGPHVPAAIELRAVGESWPVSAELGAEEGRVLAAEGSLAVRATDPTAACQALQRWIARRAKRAFLPALAELAQQSGLRYERVHLRGQRTLWGSCSSRGTISLNWKLMFVAPELVRYLMLHELAHTRHFEHSRAFWNLVTVFEPRARELDAQLDDAWTFVPKWVEA